MTSSLNPPPTPENRGDRVTGSTSEARVSHDDQTMKESLIGTDRPRRKSNVSWGSIFAGVVTFIALTVVLNLVTAGLGLGDGAGAGIWAIISLAIALAVAGGVAGALAVRGGLLHGFLTWATSIVLVLVLAGWLGGTLLGTLADQVNVTQEQITDAIEQNEGEAQETVDEAADDTASGAWWTFGGLLIGGAIAAGAGALGSRSVIRREADVVRVDRV